MDSQSILTTLLTAIIGGSCVAGVAYLIRKRETRTGRLHALFLNVERFSNKSSDLLAICQQSIGNLRVADDEKVNDILSNMNSRVDALRKESAEIATLINADLSFYAYTSSGISKEVIDDWSEIISRIAKIIENIIEMELYKKNNRVTLDPRMFSNMAEEKKFRASIRKLQEDLLREGRSTMLLFDIRGSLSAIQRRIGILEIHPKTQLSAWVRRARRSHKAAATLDSERPSSD